MEKQAGWLKNETDLPSDFSAKGRMIVAHSGIIADLNSDLKKAGLIEKPYNSWSEVSFALAAIFKADGRFSPERIAAALMCDLKCNEHINKHTDSQKRRAIERCLSRAYEPPAQRIARALPWREFNKSRSLPLPTMHNARVAITGLGIECSYDIFHSKMLFGFRGDGMRHELLSDEVTDNGIIRLRQIVSIASVSISATKLSAMALYRWRWSIASIRCATCSTKQKPITMVSSASMRWP